MLSLSNIKELTIKELKSQFDNLSGYILLTIFLGVVYFFFLKTFFLNGSVSLNGMFALLPWILAIFVPAITMGSIAAEKDKQTLEYIITKPLKTVEIVIAKILGPTIFISIGLLLTTPLAYFVSKLGPLDWGVVFASYSGGFILILALCSLGVAVSSFFKNQITSFLTTAFAIILLNIINTEFTALNLPLKLANILGTFSIIDYYTSIGRGVVESSTVVYFLIFTLATGIIAYTNISVIRYSKFKNALSKISFNLLVIASMCITLIALSQYISRIGRLDLTQNQKYTLSSATKEILRQEGKIKLDVYASFDNMPNQFKPVITELRNMLTDYKTVGKSNIEIRYYDAKTQEAKLKELTIEPIQFNLVGQDQYEVKQGYLAVVISNEDGSKTEKIPFVSSVNSLEYDLTVLINKIKAKEKPAIAFASGNGERSTFLDYQALNKVLQDQYDVKSVFFNAVPAADGGETADSANNLDELNLSQYKLIIIANPTSEYDQKSIDLIKKYIDEGGNVIYLSDGANVNQQTISAEVSPAFAGKLLSSYGGEINHDLVYDLQAKLPITVPTQGGYINVGYPMFMMVQGKKSEIIRDMPQYLIVPWASSLNVKSEDGWMPLYLTTAMAGVQTTSFNLDPMQEFQNKDLSQRTIAAVRKTDSGGTIILIGSSRLFEDQVVNASPDNAYFALGLVESLAQNIGLSQIKAKNIVAPTFVYVPNNVKVEIRYIAPAISFILLGVIGLQRIYRKKRLVKIYS